MKKPFINHSPPWEGDYSARTEDVVIYSYYEKCRNDNDRQYCEYCDEELGYDDGEYLDCNCIDAKDTMKYRGNHPNLSKITLQSILDMLPEDVKPSDVRMSINLDTGDMGIYGQQIIFSYKKTFEADPEGFKVARKQYEQNYQAYLVEKSKYDEWLRQEKKARLLKEIEELDK